MGAGTNCIVWAHALKRRRKAKGKSGDVYWRWSRWGPFCHALYGETINGRLRMVSYKPTDPKKRLIPPPIFRGASRWGDL